MASFGANAEFWKHRMYDFHDGQVGMGDGGTVSCVLKKRRWREKYLWAYLVMVSERCVGDVLPTKTLREMSPIS